MTQKKYQAVLRSTKDTSIQKIVFDLRLEYGLPTVFCEINGAETKLFWIADDGKIVLCELDNTEITALSPYFKLDGSRMSIDP